MNDDVVPMPVQRKRLPPGERRKQILETLVLMFEQPYCERITTALLAERLHVSEAALYRHFASKAQMFEAMIGRIELSMDDLVNEVTQLPGTGREHALQLVTNMLTFAENNPGLGRVIAGDALAFENEHLQKRLNALLDEHFEGTLRQYLQAGSVTDPAFNAELLAAFTLGRIHVWSRSGFTRKPTANLDASLTRLMG